MNYEVLSGRLSWPQGSVVSTEELEGCNIALLVQAGHLAPHVEPKTKPLNTAQTPAEPDEQQEQADA